MIEQSLKTNAVLLGTGEIHFHQPVELFFYDRRRLAVGKPLGAAVSALFSNMNRPSERRVHGLVRFIQTDDEQCVIEGTVDGLLPNASVQINIHEYGDLSNGCDRYA